MHIFSLPPLFVFEFLLLRSVLSLFTYQLDYLLPAVFRDITQSVGDL